MTLIRKIHFQGNFRNGQTCLLEQSFGHFHFCPHHVLMKGNDFNWETYRILFKPKFVV